MYDKSGQSGSKLPSKEKLIFYGALLLCSIALVVLFLFGAITVRRNYKTINLCTIDGETPNRLPTSVLPSSYKLSLKPDLTTESYEGSVDIELVVMNATRCIVLNAEDLKIESKDIELVESPSGKTNKLLYVSVSLLR